MPPPPIQTDADVKQALRGWPGVGTRLWPGSVPGANWLRAQPIIGPGSSPKLYAVGTTAFATQPDGLYVCLAPAAGFADAIAIEACGSGQNFNDKRSRYAPSTVSLAVWCELSWLLGAMPRGRGHRPRWELAGSFAAAPTEGAWLPIRFLRVLYVLKDSLFDQWAGQGVPQGHEFVTRYRSLRSYTAPEMQSFLRHMMLDAHFYPQRPQ